MAGDGIHFGSAIAVRARLLYFHFYLGEFPPIRLEERLPGRNASQL